MLPTGGRKGKGTSRAAHQPQHRRDGPLAADEAALAGVPVAGRLTTTAQQTDHGYRGPVMPTLPAPARTSWTYVEHPDHLARVASQLRAVDVLAIDAEFVQVRGRGPDDPSHRLALLQLAGSPGVAGAFVVDALRLADLTPLEPLFADGRILKLFHGIGADSRVLATRQLAARYTLDLEAVSRSIFGQRESGLRTMLLRACGVRLDKSLQRADWARRPLVPAMLAYAARDAEMTLVLYHWLAASYPRAIALHEVPADEPPLAVAPWIVPLVEGARPQPAEWAIAGAKLEGRTQEQVEALRQALSAVRRPGQRARVIRLIADLGLGDLISEVRPFLVALASEERAGSARALGRLRDNASVPALRGLLEDPVQDVREAAQNALALLAVPETGRAAHTAAHHQRDGAGRWTTTDATSAQPEEAAWQTALRARFGELAASPPSDAPRSGDTAAPSDASKPSSNT